MKQKLLISTLIIALIFAITDCDDSGENASDVQSNAYENLGAGYDVFDNYADVTKVKAQILDLSLLEKDGMVEDKRLEKSDFNIIEGTSIDEYMEDFSTSTTISGSYKFFSASASVNYSSSEYSKSTNQFATVKSVINKRLIQVKSEYDAEDLHPYLSDSFKKDINDDSVAGKEIFRKYGTHCMRSIISGGRLDYNVSVDSSYVSSSSTIGVQAEAAFKSVFSSGSVETETEKSTEQKRFEENMKKSLQVYGGASEYGQNIINKNDYDAWVESIADNHVFCEFGADPFIPVWEFCDDSDRSAKIEEAFDSWADDRQFIDDSLPGSIVVVFKKRGTWNNTGGDDEMALNGDDIVDVNASISFKVLDNSILQVSYKFHIKEDGGDGTEFGRDQIITEEYEYKGPGKLVGLGCDNSYELFAQARNNDGDSGFFPNEQWSDLEPTIDSVTEYCEQEDSCVLANEEPLSVYNSSMGFINAGIYYVADSDGDDNDVVGIQGLIEVPVRYTE